MSLRELIILLLGLAIVGAILRGLIVALQARRGQLRVAIDKKVPLHVNLDGPELAELPGGGARVVQRDKAESEGDSNKLETARQRAEALDLEDNGEAVPILMDSVAIGQSNDPEEFVSMDDQASNLNALKSKTVGGSLGRAAEDQRKKADVAATQHFHDLSGTSITEIGQSVCSDRTLDEFEEPLETNKKPCEGTQLAPDDSEIHLEESLTSESPSLAQQAGVESRRQDISANNGVSDSELLPSGGVDEDGQHPDEVLLDYLDDYVDDETSESVFVTADPSAPAGEETRSSPSGVSSEGREFEEDYDELGPEREDDDGLNQFSMTAGDRIGGNPAANAQVGLFDEGDEHSTGRNVRPKTLVSKATALFDSWRKRTSLEAEADLPLSEGRHEGMYVLSEGDDAVVKQETAPPDAATAASQNKESNADTSGTALAASYETGPNDETSADTVVVEGTGVADEKLSHTDSYLVEVQQETESSSSSAVRQQASVAQPAEVLVCNVMAREGSELHGDDLLEALITSGLKFGDMNIFHKRFRGTNNGPVIFSVANILNPGAFDPNAMADLRTIGVSLFLALPSPIKNLEAFEQMLDAAIRLKDSLDGELKDDHRNVMTAQTIEHYRQRIRDFELRQLRAAGNNA